MNPSCGCCTGIERVTPEAVENRPSLTTLRYRVGTYSTFLESMRSRLSAGMLPRLTTRASNDPTLAMLDAWAVVADVLTFYQERIANEDYVRTAIERRSVLELARLIGYTLRLGVAANVYLAYTLEQNSRVVIPAGSRVQSLPAAGELPQAFETAEDLVSRTAWNTIKPRQNRPQRIVSTMQTIYLAGVSANLKVNDPLMIDQNGEQTIYRIRAITLDHGTQRTILSLNPWKHISLGALGSAQRKQYLRSSMIGTLATTFVKPIPLAAIPPRNAQNLRRDLTTLFSPHADSSLRLMVRMYPALQSLYTAYRNSSNPNPKPPKIYLFRISASLFGNNALPKPLKFNRENGEITETAEWTVVEGRYGQSHEQPKEVWLDASYDTIQPQSWLLIETPETPLTKEGIIAAKLESVRAGISRSDYGISGKTTKITLDVADDQHGWITADPDKHIPSDKDFRAIRETHVYAQSEELTLAEAPIFTDVGGINHQQSQRQIELDGLYDGLQSGRWLIVSGERTDVKDSNGAIVPNIYASELVMLANAEQTLSDQPGDQPHTTITLANDLAHSYKRASVTIYANVVRATHGETRSEVLGSGNASQAFQTFALRQSPLTYTSAANIAGIDSTLHVRVNDVLWHEADNLAAQTAQDRSYITQTNDQQITSIMFGDGLNGARLPTGSENVRVVYRTGIGKAGNVAANQISLLATRPLGVKSVINPLPATGGADREDRDQARQSAPLAVLALDRLVSVQDYADFARRFAGIGKASASRVSDGHRQLVQLTIAGVDDTPLDENADVYHSLERALRLAGDPYQPFKIVLRDVVFLLLSANVVIHPDYVWTKVEPQIRAALLDAFSFAHRDFGQPAMLSVAISVMQQVAGVVYVDVDRFGGIPSRDPQSNMVITPEAIAQKIAEMPQNPPTPMVNMRNANGLQPAQIAYFSPSIADTLILMERTA